MKKCDPLGTRLNTILENAWLEGENGNIAHLDKILRPADNVNDIVDTHNQTGLNYYHSGHYEKALEQFKKALSLRSDDAKIHYNLGLTYHKMDHLDEALGQYQKAARLNPSDPETHNNLGIVYYHKSLPEKAMAEFKTALRIDSNFDLARENLRLIGEQRTKG